MEQTFALIKPNAMKKTKGWSYLTEISGRSFKPCWFKNDTYFKRFVSAILSRA